MAFSNQQLDMVSIVIHNSSSDELGYHIPSGNMNMVIFQWLMNMEKLTTCHPIPSGHDYYSSLLKQNGHKLK